MVQTGPGTGEGLQLISAVEMSFSYLSEKVIEVTAQFRGCIYNILDGEAQHRSWE